MFARVLLELANSFLDARRLRQEKLLAFRKPFAGSHSIKRVRRDRNFRLVVCRQHGPDRFALTFLELTTSTSDGKSPFGGEIVSHRKVLTGSHSV